MIIIFASPGIFVDMDIGQVHNKEIREYLRASEVLLGFLREASSAHCNAFELLLIKVYAERLKSAALLLENTSVRSLANEDRDRRQAG
jgi:hypothetical protein